MQSTVKENKDNLLEVLAILKMFIMILSTVTLYINVHENWGDISFVNNENFGIYVSASLLCLVGIIYAICLNINDRLKQSSKKKPIYWFLEESFSALIISFTIAISKCNDNEYKYLFLLLIISSVIQHGFKHGIITSLFCSFILFILDLIYCPVVEGVNLAFQKDLITVGIFIFVAWILGYYVDTEDKNNRRKDEKLDILNFELEEQSRQRQEIEALLLKNNVCYDILFENSINAIIIHRDKKIIYANESAAKLLGYRCSTNLCNKSFYKHYSEEYLNKRKDVDLNIINGKDGRVIKEESILTSDGKPIAVRNTSSFFIYNGKPTILTLLLDITSERQLETLKSDAEKNLKLLNETREFNILLTEFFTNISHELKTPVNVIYAAIQTMNISLDNYNSDNKLKCKSYLGTIKQNCFRMTKLINNILDMTKVDLGFINIEKKNSDIVNVVEDITQSVATYIQSKNIDLIFDTNVEEKIMAFDEDKIEHILLNLLSNAFKYTEPYGHITVMLEDKEKEITIKVKDDGKGIPKDKQTLIFERFGQANRSLSREYEGTGIGLYLVKSFVEMHEGVITVESEEGKGSEFIVKLPVENIGTTSLDERTFYETNVNKINVEFSDVYD